MALKLLRPFNGGPINGGAVIRGAVVSGTIVSGTIVGGSVVGGSVEGGSIMGGSVQGGSVQGGGSVVCPGSVQRSALFPVGPRHVDLLGRRWIEIRPGCKRKRIDQSFETIGTVEASGKTTDIGVSLQVMHGNSSQLFI